MRLFLVLAFLAVLPFGAAAQDKRFVQYQHGSTAFVATYVGGDGVSPSFLDWKLKNTFGIPWTDIVGLRSRNGVRFTAPAGARNTFVGTLATPVLIDNTRVKLDEVIVQMEIGAGVIVEQVEIYDGATSILDVRQFNRSGPLDLTRKTAANTFKLPEGTEIWNGGLAVIVRARFVEEGSIRFLGLGAHFLH